MSRSRASDGSASVAVVGAGTPCGALVREALAEQRVAGSRVRLFGTVEGDAVLSEYRGEARLIQAPDLEEIGRHEVIFVCEDSPAAAATIERRLPSALVVDLMGIGSAADGPLVHPSLNPEAARGPAGVLRAPHAIASLLAESLLPVERLAEIRSAAAVVLRPAADFGEPGLEELRDQTVGLLRFVEPPKSVFGGRQLAFNVIPEAGLGEAAEAGLERRVASEVASLLGWPERRLTVSLVAAPVFHGHAASVRIVPGRPLPEAELRSALACGGPSRGGAAAPAVTPLDAAGERRTSVSEAWDDGIGGVWLWVIAGEAGPASAANAVRLADLAGRL